MLGDGSSIAGRTCDDCPSSDIKLACFVTRQI